MDGRNEGLDISIPENGEVNPEVVERMKIVAKNMIASFCFNPYKESFLLITDDNVIKNNGILVEALREELERLTSKDPRSKGNYKIMVAKASPHSAEPFGEEIGKQMKDKPVLILTSMSRSHSKETGEASRGDLPNVDKYTDILSKMSDQDVKFSTGGDPKSFLDSKDNEDDFYAKLQELAKARRSRIISCTKGTNPFEILTKGAIEEDPALLTERGNKVNELMKDVKVVHITTSDGTDLLLKPRYDKNEIEDGDLSKPGALSNIPFGEWSCSPFWSGANGTLVIDGPFGGKSAETGRWHNLDWIKEAGNIKLTINNGEIVEINSKKVEDQRTAPDNDLIKSFIVYLDSGNNNNNHAYKLAEFAVGLNTMACKDKPDNYWGSTETEKKYGTSHIAFGSNGTFGVTNDDPNRNLANVHCDMIILDPQLTIECNKKDGTKFNLIENGLPIGY